MLVCIHFLPDNLTDAWIDSDQLDCKLRQYMRDITLRKHKHRHNPRPKSEKQGGKLENVGKCSRRQYLTADDKTN